MHSDESAAAPDESFECRLLAGIEDIACRIEEHHHPIFRQALIREQAGVFRGFDAVTILLTERLNGGDARGNGVMPERRGFREHQDTERRLRRFCAQISGRDDQKHDSNSGNEPSVRVPESLRRVRYFPCARA